MVSPEDLGLIPVTGLLGHGISYSLSPMLHGFADRAAGRMSDYQLFDVPPTGLRVFLEQVVQFGEVVGFNVTNPHKETLYERLDALHDDAKETGAVNTVSVRGEHIVGYNTDRAAFRSALQAALTEREHPAKDWTVVVLGAGGGARAVVRAILDLGIAQRILISSRTESRRFFLLLHFQEICNALGVELLQHEWQDWETMPIESPALLVNATPLGRMDDRGRIPLPAVLPMDSIFAKFSLVFDLVYTPPVTGLMKRARDLGVQAVGGGGMLIEQAVLSRAIWFGDDKKDQERAAMVAGYSLWATKVARMTNAQG